MIYRRGSSFPKEDVVSPRLLYCDSRCSQTCGRRSGACRQQTQIRRRCSQTWRRRSPVPPGVSQVPSGAGRCSQTYHNHSHGTPVPVIRDISYSEGRPNAPLVSDTLLKLTHLSLHSTFSQTLLEASSYPNTFCWWVFGTYRRQK